MNSRGEEKNVEWLLVSGFAAGERETPSVLLMLVHLPAKIPQRSRDRGEQRREGGGKTKGGKIGKQVSSERNQQMNKRIEVIMKS